MRRLLAQALALRLSDLFKGQNVRQRLGFLRQTLRWTPEDIASYQWRELGKLLDHARTTVPFYRDRFASHQLGPQSFKSPADLSRLPPLTRRELQENYYRLISSQADPGRCYHGSSSGSTGEPVHYLKDREASSAGIAAGLLGWELAGWQLGDKTLHIWGNPRVIAREWGSFSSKAQAFLWNRRRVPAYRLHDPDLFHQLLQILRQKPFAAIDGYANAIYSLAQFAAKQALRLPVQPLLLTTGETLQDYQRDFLFKNLGRVFDGYGCGEINGVAYQCNRCGMYHIIDPHVLVEYDRNEPAGDGSYPILLTDLNNRSFPLIRYQVGDLGIPGENSRCPVPYQTIRKITGRQADIIDLPQGGRLLVPSFFGSRLLKELQGLRRYQIVRTQPDCLLIKLETTPDFSAADLKSIEAALQEYLGNRIRWQIEQAGHLSFPPSGKFKLFVDETAPEKKEEK